ncbi:WXG100 family type VII secretion target [Streptomyces yunnanensis]|uniref:WXG100 family type VII secretion target n=1 Tax=Streptomyces yunnanensis TaxID=156453 RepID=A0A9X8QNM0_9ACTN|nr:WXG100 family type VII secretion target [Streptomyces yunnanensis]SHK96442.1 WXG100 family type VII secretion target [Streptomyces yunnanensis]
MAGNTALTYAEIERLKGEIQSGSQAMSSQLRTLVNAIATVESAWTGQGASAFKQAQNALNEDHAALRRMLDGINDAIAHTSTTSKANDAEVLSSFRGIDVNGAAPGGNLNTGSASGISNF